jgi:putative membrane protein
MKTNYLSIASKGLVVGASMLVPGVSGGTTAIILGIYDRLIKSISDFFKDVKGNLAFLAVFCLGAGAGILLFAKLILWAVESWHFPMMFLFIGAIVGSLPMLYKQAKVQKFSPLFILYALIGAAIVLSLGFLPKPEASFSGGGFAHILMLILTGIIIAIALVLPGISTSHMLLVLGMYATTLNAVETFNFAYLLPLIGGVGLGIILTTKLLELALTKAPQVSYFVIIGFVAGSLVSKEVFPGIPQGWDILFCVLTFALGFFVIRLVSRYAKD